MADYYGPQLCYKQKQLIFDIYSIKKTDNINCFGAVSVWQIIS